MFPRKRDARDRGVTCRDPKLQKEKPTTYKLIYYTTKQSPPLFVSKPCMTLGKFLEYISSDTDNFVNVMSFRKQVECFAALCRACVFRPSEQCSFFQDDQFEGSHA